MERITVITFLGTGLRPEATDYAIGNDRAIGFVFSLHH